VITFRGGENKDHCRFDVAAVAVVSGAGQPAPDLDRDAPARQNRDPVPRLHPAGAVTAGFDLAPWKHRVRRLELLQAHDVGLFTF